MPARSLALAGVAGLAFATLALPARAETLSVLSFNIYWGATLTEDSLERTVAVIEESGADVVGIQEKMTFDERGEAFAVNSAQEIARRLGWQMVDQTRENDGAWSHSAILTRFPVDRLAANEMCVTLTTPAAPVRFCNLHLMSAPYQPYQLLHIPYRDAPLLETAEEAIRAAEETRGAAIDALAEDLAEGGDLPTILVGDFNEPSHLDWTQAAADAGLHPIAVAFPTTRRLEELGFRDAYRTLHPDEVARPGHTWTPTTSADDPQDHHDRIDFVLFRGSRIDLRDASVLGEAGPMTDVAMEPWPSDHRAVLAVFEVTAPANGR